MIGRLEYDQKRDRYLIVDEISGEELAELHCGHAFGVLLPDGWTDTRIEYGINLDRKLRMRRDGSGAGHGVLIGGMDTEQWYLAGTHLTGWQLMGLFVRLPD